MKSLIFGVALCAAAFPALAQTNVSISVGQPGFYGRVDIGDFAPQPVLYAPQPVIVRQVPQYYRAEPVYLRVPPGHRKHWSKFCGRYDACGRPVLFVRDEWYTNTYVPRYREHYHGGRPEVRVVERVEYRDRDRGYDRGPGRWEEHGGGHGRGHDRDDDRGHGEGHGHGNGHGNGHGRGHD
jgi:hypothetical protein